MSGLGASEVRKPSCILHGSRMFIKRSMPWFFPISARCLRGDGRGWDSLVNVLDGEIVAESLGRDFKLAGGIAKLEKAE